MHLAVAYVGFILLTMKINPAKFLETEIINTNGIVETSVLMKTTKLPAKTCQRGKNITQSILTYAKQKKWPKT